MALLGGFDPDGRALAVFVHMAFPQKLDALSSILRLIDDNLANVYREQVQPLLKQAQEKRNTMLHQAWFSEADSVIRVDIRARGVLKFAFLPVPLQELKEAATFINDAQSTLFRLTTIPLAPKE